MGDDNIMEYNGGSVVALKGKNCVAIACDLRYGERNQTVGMNFPKVFREGERCLVGASGLASDIQTVAQEIHKRANLYRLREEREVQPKVLASMISSLLYDHRWGPYFVEPVVAGLGEDNKPFICSTDVIGCLAFADDFVCTGTASEAMMGVCEALWKPDLEPDDLFEVASQSLLAALDRDAFSGWGALVHILTPEELITRQIRTRQD